MLTKRLLSVVTATAALTLAGLLTVTDAQGSVAAAPTVAPSVSKSPSPPSVPTGLTATAVTATSVTLSWDASRPGCCGVDGYDVTWSQAFDDVYRLTRAGDVTTVTITEGILPAAQFTFRVAALDDAGHRSLSSEPVTVVTPRSDSAADRTPPQAPGGLTVTGESAAGVGLSWSPSADDVAVTGYNVYWFDGWFTSRLVATVTGTSVTAPLDGARNVYYVRARDAANNVSIASNTVTVNATPPTPPPARCKVGYQNTAQWGSGFVASVTITNTGTAPLDGWILGFSLADGQLVTSAWNGAYTQNGPAVTLRNVDWNAALAPGASRTVGFQGSWAAPAPPPAAFTLNGAPCVAAV